MFQIKAFFGIIASMINRLRVVSTVLTDFNVGSNIRVLLEAVAQEIDELYQQMVAALQAAIAQAVYTSFGFTPLPAVSATTTIEVTIAIQTSDTTIAAGSVFTPQANTTIVYTSTADATIYAGQTSAMVPVVASSAGVAGNLPADTLFTVSPSPAGFMTAENQVAISNGVDIETAAAQYIRFQAFITSLVRATIAGIYYGAGSVFLTDAFGNVIEKVVACQVFSPYDTDTSQPAWIFKVYIYNGVASGPGASAQLIAQTQTILDGYYDAQGNPVDGYKAAGTVAQVLAVTVTPVPITGVLTLTATTSTAAAIAAAESAWATYVTGLPTAGEFVKAKLVNIALDLAGVTDCQISAPTANIAGSPGVQLVPGAFSVTATGGATP